MREIKFKSFLLNENKAYLGDKIGYILSAIHDIEDGKGMGTRELVRFSEKIVSSIRRILHSNWSKNELIYLKTLQKIGVALMNSIEQKDNLKEILPSVRQEFEKLSKDVGVTINDLGNESKT